MPRKAGDVDYLARIKSECCCVYWGYCSVEDKDYFERTGKIFTKQGPDADGEKCSVAIAFERFALLRFDDRAAAEQAQGLQRHQFLYIVQKYLARWRAEGDDLLRRRTPGTPDLTEDHVFAMATILGTPVFVNGGLRYHRSVNDAIEHSAEFRRMARRSGMSQSFLHRHLLQNASHLLKYGKVDQSQTVSVRTRAARSEASDV